MWARTPEFDERDAEILKRNQTSFDKLDGARNGDVVIFACGTVRRISYIWAFEEEPRETWSVQTSDVGGSGWYFGDGHVSYSGSLYRSVKYGTLTPTDETRDCPVWFFHHDWAQAHNGVYCHAKFRVFKCSENAPD